MRLLLDTHALLWWVAGDARRMSARARATVEEAEAVHVSAVTGYEITLKHDRGRLPEGALVARDVAVAVLAEDFAALPVTLRHAELAGRLPLHHRDPFDRMLAAQALAEALTVVSADAAFDAYAVPRLW